VATDAPDGAGGHRPERLHLGHAVPFGHTRAADAPLAPASVRHDRQPKLIDELDRTLRRDRFRPHVALEDVDDLIDELRRHAEPANDPERAAPVSRDPDDDYLIALALEADADALVSGDLDLTDLDDPPVRIVTPRALLDELITGT
jgi:putative PIN family toxin of toxin-antitoxin system